MDTSHLSIQNYRNYPKTLLDETTVDVFGACSPREIHCLDCSLRSPVCNYNDESIFRKHLCKKANFYFYRGILLPSLPTYESVTPTRVRFWSIFSKRETPIANFS